MDLSGRRVHYHVTYDDGDEEDLDYEEVKFAVELQQAVALGTYQPVEASEIPSLTLEDDDGSMDESYDGDLQIKAGKKRKLAEPGRGVAMPAGKLTKGTAKRKGKQELNRGGKTTFSIESVLESFQDTTEYGAAFRSMTADAQQTEVVRLNKGAASGMKGAIRKQRIDTQFKEVVSEKMKAFFIGNRTEPKSMIRHVVQARNLHKLQLKFLSVGTCHSGFLLRGQPGKWRRGSINRVESLPSL